MARADRHSAIMIGVVKSSRRELVMVLVSGEIGRTCLILGPKSSCAIVDSMLIAMALHQTTKSNG